MMRIAIASDHAGFDLKTTLVKFLRANGYHVEDLGTHSGRPVDYPDYAEKVGLAVREQRVDRGILICGSGVGVSIAANKIPGVRAGLCHDVYSAHQGVEHDDMNVLALGSWVVSEKLSEELVLQFLRATYSSEPRQVRRLNKVTSLEEKYSEQLVQGNRTLIGATLDDFSYQVPADAQEEVIRTLDDWQAQGTLQALWKRDPSVWTRSGEEKWLGWLDVAEQELEEADGLQQFSDLVRQKGFQHVVLLGMGGSSLCAEVLAKTFGAAGAAKGYLEYHGLDSTDPVQIRELEESIPLEKTLFIVSSKSGSTLEPNIFFDYFFDRVKSCVGEAEAGSHFVAITDPGTSLEKRATDARFLRVFPGVPSIGGRYSVLSNFGMVPAALIGVDVRRFLAQAQHMVRLCSRGVQPSANPGVQLGLILGACAKLGRDKVTIICSEDIADFGAWLEQLLAESTGKQGKGLIPIDRERIRAPDAYGTDRVFVYHRSKASSDRELDMKVLTLEKAGQPLIRIGVRDPYNLGQEFFRWEMAVSVAGAVLGINPFDQPDVEASKDVTRKLTSEYETTGKLPEEIPVLQSGDIQIFDDPANEVELKRRLGASPSVSDYLRAHLERVGEGDYFAILAYLPMNARDEELLQAMRDKIGTTTKVATCVEFGPRFLHSTGQAYKGGPNSGVFLQITCEDKSDIPVPGHKYTFGVVKAAEARGDLEVLTSRHRRAMRIHLRRDPSAGLEQLNQELDKAVA